MDGSQQLTKGTFFEHPVHDEEIQNDRCQSQKDQLWDQDPKVAAPAGHPTHKAAPERVFEVLIGTILIAHKLSALPAPVTLAPEARHLIASLHLLAWNPALRTLRNLIEIAVHLKGILTILNPAAALVPLLAALETDGLATFAVGPVGALAKGWLHNCEAAVGLGAPF